MKVRGTHHRTVWFDAGDVCMIDQPGLPFAFEIVRLKDHRQTATAIADMTVRGAGAIGATGGFGMAQAVLEAPEENFQAYVEEAAARLRATRPTAQNLFYAIDRVLAAMERGLPPEGQVAAGGRSSAAEGQVAAGGRLSAAEGQAPTTKQPGAGAVLARAREMALAEAQAIADEDAEACRKIGEFGATLISDGARVSTHCNAGWLAFVDWGSALSPVYVAVRQNKKVFVWVDETRPRGQGAKLTAWELAQEEVPFKVLCDGASASYMKRGEIDLVIVGSDRIAANGDVANKIGTYPAALAAREAGVPFYVAAPSSTIDATCPSGEAIPIEERSEDEVNYVWGQDDEGKLRRVRVTPDQARAGNPAFDVTSAHLVNGIITEFGIVEANEAGIAKAVKAREMAYSKSRG